MSVASLPTASPADAAEPQRAPVAPAVDVLGEQPRDEVADEPPRPALEPAEPPDGSAIDTPDELAALLAVLDDRAPEPERLPAVSPMAEDAMVTAVADRISRAFERRFIAIDDADALDRLAGRMYERLRGRLRSELLVDRERGGALTPFR